MTVSKTLTLVTAVAAKNSGIGINNDLPWRLPKELAHFNQVTKTASHPRSMNACIMGRRTWDSIPLKFRPLDGRYNIIITSTPNHLQQENPPHSVTMPSIQAALTHIDQINQQGEMAIERAFVVGGSRVYREAMEMADRRVQILLTRVEFKEADRCDAFFPEIDMERFKRQPLERLREVAGYQVPEGIQTSRGIDYEFMLYESE